MILNKYSLKGKMHLHLKFETFYINFQDYFMKFAFFKKLVLKLKNMYDILRNRPHSLYVKQYIIFFNFNTNSLKNASFINSS